MKIVIAIAFVLILGSLFSALFYMMRGDRADGRRMVRALSLRIGFSILLFVGLLAARHFGWIEMGGPMMAR